MVLHLLRGQRLEFFSRDPCVEARRIATWRDNFLEPGTGCLKGQWAVGDDPRLRARPNARSSSSR